MSSGYELELTLTSAKDLKNVNWRHGPNRPYAVIWVDPDRKVTTRVDEEGDDSPTWNEKFVLPLSRPVDRDSTLYIDIVHAKTPDDDSDTKPLIGSAKLRLHEILDAAGGYNAATPITEKLKLKRPSGRPQGKVFIEAVIHDRRYGHGVPGQYGVRGYGGDAPVHPAGQGYSYSVQPPPPQHDHQYGVGNPSGYPNYYGGGGGPPSQQQYYGDDQEKKSKSGGMGMGTGLAVGAAAGLAGGVALAVGYDALTDEIAEDAAEKVEEEDYGDDEE